MSSELAALSSMISVHRKFSDIDEFAQATVGWDLDLRQLEAGNADLSVELIVSPNLIIQHYHFPFAIHQRGLPPAGFTTFGLLFGESRLHWASRESSDAVLVDFNNPNGFEAASGAGFRGIGISVSNEMLTRNAALMGLQDAPFVGSGQALLRSENEENLVQLRQYLRFQCGQSMTALNPQNAFRASTELENEVTNQLLIGLAESQKPLDDAPLWTRQKGLRLAISFIEENVHENPRITDICTASHLSWRSLDRVFKECFGIGPKRYLLQLRLIRVRQQLKNASPETKVSDIANALGFWHMGDFAQKYRKFFGEYPKEQLIKSR